MDHLDFARIFFNVLVESNAFMYGLSVAEVGKEILLAFARLILNLAAA